MHYVNWILDPKMMKKIVSKAERAAVSRSYNIFMGKICYRCHITELMVAN